MVKYMHIIIDLNTNNFESNIFDFDLKSIPRNLDEITLKKAFEGYLNHNNNIIN